MEIIDAYSHCGLRKYQPIEDVRRVMEAAGVTRAVLVQHLGEFDNSYIGAIAAAEPERFAGVCLVDHESPDAVGELCRLAASGRFRGVRLAAAACVAVPEIPRAAAELGLVIVLYTPDGIGASAGWLAGFLEESPGARVVLTHLGNPDLSGTGAEGHREALRRLAAHAGVHFQVSGMKMFCSYPHTPLHGLIVFAFEHFGADRLLWGSNYPVVGGEEDYLCDLRLLIDGGLPLPREAIPAVASGNARRLWFERELR